MNNEQTDLKAEQRKTLEGPKFKPGIFMKFLLIQMDILYGSRRTLKKFFIIEMLARYPYWAWENGGYLLLTRKYLKSCPVDTAEEKKALGWITLGRAAQDNEQCHLMLIKDIMRQKGEKMGLLKGMLIPRSMALGYYYFTRFLFRFAPGIAFKLNADFETHAEIEYMKIVEEHPEWETEKVDSEYFKFYPGEYNSMADLFIQLGLDERRHKEESLREYEQLSG